MHIPVEYSTQQHHCEYSKFLLIGAHELGSVSHLSCAGIMHEATRGVQNRDQSVLFQSIPHNNLPVSLFSIREHPSGNLGNKLASNGMILGKIILPQPLKSDV